MNNVADLAAYRAARVTTEVPVDMRSRLERFVSKLLTVVDIIRRKS